MKFALLFILFLSSFFIKVEAVSLLILISIEAIALSSPVNFIFFRLSLKLLLKLM